MPILKSEDYNGFQISVCDETVLRPDGEGDSPSTRYSVYIDGRDVSREVGRAGFTPEQLVERARRWSTARRRTWERATTSRTWKAEARRIPDDDFPGALLTGDPRPVG